MGAATSAAMAAPPSPPAPPPPPPPPPPPVPVAVLPGDMQRLILERIPCSADQVSMSLVCRAWRDMVVGHRDPLLPPPPPPLPLLLLPADPFDARGVRAACALSGGRVHHTLDIIPPNARCFGSHDGVWIFLSTLEPRRAHVALNIRSGDTRAIPSGLLRWTDPQRHVHGMLIHAAALSTSPGEANCVGAAIVTSWPPFAAMGAVDVDALPPHRRCVALWRQDGLQAFDFVMPPGDGEDVEDVIFIRAMGAFAFLTRGEDLHICRAILHQDHGLQTQWGTVRFRPGDRLFEPTVRARYLVVSDGKLLMVIRFTPSRNAPTSRFKVFVETDRDDEEGDVDPDFPLVDYPCEWTELSTLDGRMLFVGHGCSRSYRVDQYPGFQEGVYFLDDGEYYDDAVLFTNLKHYPCSDNGKWSEGRIERCFPMSDPSDHSAPVWLLP
nr:unnamed protein product [Digitaria exilis]